MEPKGIGRYRVLREIGRGAMGAVYLAHDPAIDRQVAIKTIAFVGDQNSREQQEARQRFLREAQAAGRLMHPNIISVFDVGTFDDGNLFIAMEYLQGQTLESFTTRPDLLPADRALSLVCDACLALDYAHRNKVVHRDIKPSNLMLVEGERLKITDFGIAKDHRTTVTEDGTLLGTPAYMSPEQATGRAVDGRSDLFSLGVVLYELLTGERPFEGDSPSAVLYQIVHEEPREPRILTEHLPSQFSTILRTALHKNPAARFPTGRAMAEALRNHESFQAATARTMVMPADCVPLVPPPPALAETPAAVPPTLAPVLRRRAPRRGVQLFAGIALGAAALALATPSYRDVWTRTLLPKIEGLFQPRALATPAQPMGTAPATPFPELRLDADRPGARFYLDGSVLDGSSLRWEAGLAGSVLTASDGCFRGAVRLDASLDPGVPLSVDLDEPVLRSVELRSRPEAARVEVDGVATGRTPMTVEMQACREHTIVLSRAGHHPRTVTFTAGGDWEELTRSVLRLAPLENGRVIFEAPYPVTVQSGGETLGSSGQVLLLPAGSHELTFRSRDHRVDVTERIEIASDTRSTRPAPVPPLGTVRVLAYPGNAVILVDGIEADAPPANLELGAGEHEIECRWNVGDRPPAKQTVLVQAGQTHTVRFK